ncbi:MAG: glycosyl hydrolase 53 family protein, partial [Mariniphaga sp.]
MEGPVCDDLEYTIVLTQKAKQFGFKIFLNFHYSDTWADPGKQFVPKAWENLEFLSNKYTQEISVVETAYFANGWYPEPGEHILNVQLYPPTEQGQHDFLMNLAAMPEKYPKITSVYYWKPDGLDIPGSEIPYLGRSLFNRNGNAFKG